MVVDVVTAKPKAITLILNAKKDALDV